MSNDGGGGMGCLALLVIVVAGVWFAVWGRHSELRYEYQYSGHNSTVSVDKKPRDCDFLQAPMGRKDCYYDKEVWVYKYRRDSQTGRAIVSYDDGRTWGWNDGGPENGQSVRVVWTKKAH